MRWHLDEHGRLVITVTKREQRALKAAQRRDEHGRCEPPFDSDEFMRQVLEPVLANGEYTWLPEACTDDLTSAPMLGLLGDKMPGPDNPEEALGLGLLHVGC
jgi:protein involved in temperature-dependent protein secretion